MVAKSLAGRARVQASKEAEPSALTRAMWSGRHLAGLLEVASGDADQACVVAVVGQPFGIRLERVDEPAQRRIDRPLVREPAQHRDLAGARAGAAVRHVGGLIPVEQAAGRLEIADLGEAALELGELVLRRRAIALPGASAP